jgi:hypothetical protein
MLRVPPLPSVPDATCAGHGHGRCASMATVMWMCRYHATDRRLGLVPAPGADRPGAAPRPASAGRHTPPGTMPT